MSVGGSQSDERSLGSYCLVSPCRNEAKFLEQTLRSVTEQTILPQAWIIVDDGSSDETPALLAAAAAQHPWIRIVRREDRGSRKVGPGVVDAFYAGYDRIADQPWQYICKLDMDLVLPPTYFESLIRRMAADPRLGTTSGQAYYEDQETGELVSERISAEMSVGASKFYRRRCFEQIGGLVREVMWDGIDCHRARMLGWRAGSSDDPETHFLHLRPMGSSQQDIWTGRMRHGYGQWFMGTGLMFMTASAVYRMSRPPRVFGGLAMWWGYVKSALTGKRRLDDLGFRRFLRKYQRRMLFRGKHAATELTETERAATWDPEREPSWSIPRPAQAEPGPS